ncbi:MAG: SDR family oxidoreductase [Ruminococcus sp.]|jgi:3-oxoacyl-[acyl-carrier protein] reductase|nr:SDR family oxidoreductase [Ruminococcus sp.]
MYNLKNKNIIITGAASGIGKATLELFAKSGANIWACVHNQDADFTSEYDGFIKKIHLDLSDSDSIKNAAKEILADKLNIDVLVNCAAINQVRMFMLSKIDDMKKLFDVNFFGQMEFTQKIAKRMMTQKSGNIINIASKRGIEPFKGRLAYSAAKAAFISATKTLSKELAPYNIRVNAVAPADIGGTGNAAEVNAMNVSKTISTELNLMERQGLPVEIANVIFFLASDMSSYITGQTIIADGGAVDNVSEN